MGDNYKIEWCGCELKDDEGECDDSYIECEDCQVYKDYWAAFEKEKAEFEATQKERVDRLNASLNNQGERTDG